MKKLQINITVFVLTIALSACAFVSLNPQAQDVAVLPNADAVGKCKFLGNTSVSIWSKSETFQSQDTVEDQLNTLARNEAVKIGGNTVTPDSKIINGQRTYRVYNCPIE